MHTTKEQKKSNNRQALKTLLVPRSKTNPKSEIKPNLLI